MGRLITEQEMESRLIEQLTTLGYEKVSITTEEQLIANLKKQLEHNYNTTFSAAEFHQITNHLNKGNIFEKAHTLRNRFDVKRDDGTTLYIQFINQKDWCKNSYQVTHQVTMEGTYTNRYDVTLLINGLPLVQIELKRSGIELREAFNQTGRYAKHSYGAGKGLFQYIQLFVISNGTLTKYYANTGLSSFRSFEQTFYWTDAKNNAITRLRDFTNVFLEKCHLSKMITRYMVMNESSKVLMVLRPYQYYAVEKMVVQVNQSTKNAYIWHTTGSGKTLTSFMASRLIQNIETVDLVLFVVDRKDLDAQTIEEFNSFSPNSVDNTNSTQHLVSHFEDPHRKLIVTTIQKLNNAITGNRYAKVMDAYRDKRVVFIFDECHRSQFGKTHQNIVRFFPNSQLFGFTGTPIFDANAQTKVGDMRTTRDLFGECLHKYVITDAINDENVLRFSVEYYSTFKKQRYIDDEQVEGIDTEEVYQSPQHMEQVVNYILANHDRKTHGKKFNALFAITNIPTLIGYYDLFEKKRQEGKHNLVLATIYSYGSNEDGLLDEADEGEGQGYVHTREKLEEFIEHYNEEFGTNYNTRDSYYDYYRDVGERVKNGNIDILLVVNMFLTGFDSKKLNTLYVDKNLRHHGLIQAYSRTNRIYGSLKSQGNIICFRNLKKATDEAVELFANKEATETIIIPPYEEFVARFIISLAHLQKLVPTPDEVMKLKDEEAQANFVQAFRELMRIMNQLKSFSDFDFSDLQITETEYTDYLSHYQAIKEKVDQQEHTDKVSILNDLDFELELVAHDHINVTYILTLLESIKGDTLSEQARIRKQVEKLLQSEPKLRSKKELIEQFMEKVLPHIPSADQVKESFLSYWDEEKDKAQEAISKDENLDIHELNKIINNYLYTGHVPQTDDLINAMQQKPSFLERRPKAKNILNKIDTFIDTFITGL